jgi:hypothetical protein
VTRKLAVFVCFECFLAVLGDLELSCFEACETGVHARVEMYGS